MDFTTQATSLIPSNLGFSVSFKGIATFERSQPWIW